MSICTSMLYMYREVWCACESVLTRGAITFSGLSLGSSLRRWLYTSNERRTSTHKLCNRKVRVLKYLGHAQPALLIVMYVFGNMKIMCTLEHFLCVCWKCQLVATRLSNNAGHQPLRVNSTGLICHILMYIPLFSLIAQLL